MKVVFAPVSIVGGFAAGFGGKKLFSILWSRIDDQEPPQPEHRDVPIGKMLAAMALQGAVFYVVRGLTEHQLRRGFAAVTGSWPGEKRPDEV